jgi:hypothetical protein
MFSNENDEDVSNWEDIKKIVGNYLIIFFL